MQKKAIHDCYKLYTDQQYSNDILQGNSLPYILQQYRDAYTCLAIMKVLTMIKLKLPRLMLLWLENKISGSKQGRTMKISEDTFYLTVA